jgi:hypothetical protein
MRIRNLVQTCTACPSQWDAESEDGRPVYIRYRWGHLTAEYWEIVGVGDYDPSVIFHSSNQGGAFDGVMTTEEMIEKIGFEVID